MRGAARSINRANETSPAHGSIIPLDRGKRQTKTADLAQPFRELALVPLRARLRLDIAERLVVVVLHLRAAGIRHQPDRAEAIGMIPRFVAGFLLGDSTQRGDREIDRRVDNTPSSPDTNVALLSKPALVRPNRCNLCSHPTRSAIVQYPRPILRPYSRQGLQ